MPEPQYKLPDVTKQINDLPYDTAVKDALYDAFYADSLQDTVGMLNKANVPNEVKDAFYQVRAKAEKGKPYDRNIQSLQSFTSRAPKTTSEPVTSTPPASAKKTEQATDYSGVIDGVKNFGRGLLKGTVENTAKNVYEMGKRLLPADESDTTGRAAQMIAGPAGALVVDLVKSQVGQFGKAYDAARAGQPLEASGQLVAGMIPLIGPAVAHGAEKLGNAAAEGSAEGIGEAIGDIGVAAIPAFKSTGAIPKGRIGRSASRQVSKSETGPPPKSARESAAVFQDPAQIDIAQAKAKARQRMAEKKAGSVKTEQPPMKQLPEGKFPRFYADETGKTVDATKPVMEVSDVAPIVEPVMAPVGTQLEAPTVPTRMIAPPAPKGQPEPSRFTAPEKGPVIDSAAKDPVSLIDDLSARLEQATTPEQRAAIAQELREISQSISGQSKAPVHQLESPRPQAQLPAPTPEGTAMAQEMSTTGRITPLDPQTMKFAQSAPTEQLMQYVEYGERALASGVIMDPQAFIKAQVQLNTVKNELANRGEGGTFDLMPNQPPVSAIIPSAPAGRYPVERNAAKPQTIEAVAEPVVEPVNTAPKPVPAPQPVPDVPKNPTPVAPQATPEPTSKPVPAPTPQSVEPVAPPVVASAPVAPPPAVDPPVVSAPQKPKGQPPKTKTTEPPVAQPIAESAPAPVIQSPPKPNSETGVTITEVVPKNGKVAYRDDAGLSATYSPEKGEVVFNVGNRPYGAIRKGDRVMISDIVNDPDGNTAIMIPFTGDLSGSVSSHFGGSYKPASTATPPVKAPKPKEIKADEKTILPKEEPEPKKKVETSTKEESKPVENKNEEPIPDELPISEKTASNKLVEEEREWFRVIDSTKGTKSGSEFRDALDKYLESASEKRPDRDMLYEKMQRALDKARIDADIPSVNPAHKATGSIYVKRGHDSAQVVGPKGDAIGSLELIRKNDGTVKVLVFDSKNNKLGDSVLSILNDKALATVAKEYLGKK